MVVDAKHELTCSIHALGMPELHLERPCRIRTRDSQGLFARTHARIWIVEIAALEVGGFDKAREST
jgi:hypothetical protein